MELRSKSQREAVGPDVADRDLSGEAVIRLVHDPSPPVLSPVRLQTTPVLSDSNTDDAEQRQEHVHTTTESGSLTQTTNDARFWLRFRQVSGGPVLFNWLWAVCPVSKRIISGCHWINGLWEVSRSQVNYCDWITTTIWLSRYLWFLAAVWSAVGTILLLNLL